MATDDQVMLRGRTDGHYHQYGGAGRVCSLCGGEPPQQVLQLHVVLKFVQVGEPARNRRLVKQDAPAPFSFGYSQVEFWDANSLGVGGELLLPEEKQLKVFNGERVKKNRERFEAIVNAIGLGMPMLSIAAAFRVSRNTLAAIVANNAERVEQVRKRAAGLGAVAFAMMYEQIIENPEKVPWTHKATTGAIGMDKSLLVDGRPTSISETKRAISPEDFNDWIEAIPSATPAAADHQVNASVDVESTVTASEPQQIRDAAGSGSVTGSQKGGSGGQKGGGGGPASELGGETAMDSAE